MSSYTKYRDIHLYVGLALLLPIVVISASGIILNHEKALGLKGGYEIKEGDKKEGGKKDGTKKDGEKKDKKEKDNGSYESTTHEPGLLASATAWSDHSDAIQQAISRARDQWGEVPLERVELKDEHDFGLVVKVKAAKEAMAMPDEIVWSVAHGTEVIKKEEEKVAAGGWNWKKINKDLHTGKFFSDHLGFLWSDITAFALLALSLTGVVLYAIPVLKKRAKKNKPKPQPKTTGVMPGILPEGLGPATDATGAN